MSQLPAVPQDTWDTINRALVGGDMRSAENAIQAYARMAYGMVPRLDAKYIADLVQQGDADLRPSAEALAGACHMLSVRAGWWDGVDPGDKYVFGTKIALVHSEVAEAMEGGRKNKMDDHLPHRKAEEVELADAVIRVFDLACARGHDIIGAMIEKMVYNARRPDHKPEARAAEGGKSF